MNRCSENCTSITIVLLFLILAGLIYLVYLSVLQGIQDKEKYHGKEKECSTHIGVITNKIFESGINNNFYYVYFNLEHKISCRGVVSTSSRFDQLKIGQKFLCKPEFCQVSIPIDDYEEKY